MKELSNNDYVNEEYFKIICNSLAMESTERELTPAFIFDLLSFMVL